MRLELEKQKRELRFEVELPPRSEEETNQFEQRPNQRGEPKNGGKELRTYFD